MNIQQNPSDPWKWWRNALNGDFGPIHDGEPEQGYFRSKDNEPVAIWRDADGNWIALKGKRQVEAEKIWTWVCNNPISHEYYEQAVKNGQFPDDPPPIGHNSMIDDPFEKLSEQLAGERELVEAFLSQAVTTQEQANKAAVWSKRIAEISKEADQQRKEEKQPHLDASRAVDDKWRDLIDGAKGFVASLKKHVEPFLIAEKRKEDERRCKAAEEAEALRRKAAESDQKSEAERERLQQQAAEAEAEAKAKPTQAGRTGAKVSLRTEKTGKVVDYEKAAAALIAMKHPDMIALIDKLAQRAAKSGMPFDGMEIVEVERAI